MILLLIKIISAPSLVSLILTVEEVIKRNIIYIQIHLKYYKEYQDKNKDIKIYKLENNIVQKDNIIDKLQEQIEEHENQMEEQKKDCEEQIKQQWKMINFRWKKSDK